MFSEKTGMITCIDKFYVKRVAERSACCKQKCLQRQKKCALKDSTKFQKFVYILSVHVIRVETTCCCFQVVIVSFHSESFVES